MSLQTDQEFKQRKIFKLNKKFNVEMYSKNLMDGKAFAAEQKIRELKKLYQETNVRKNLKENELNQMN